MRALIQRVCRATVRVEEQVVGQIDRGLLILLGISDTDGLSDMEYVAEKCVNLRIFEDDQGKMNRSLLDTGGQALVVSQFTLHADTRKGRRPSFNRAAPPDIANAIYEQFVQRLRTFGIYTETGVFGAYMQVEIHNTGPVTLMIDSEI
ncbi:MAG: D-tyrosyl-tRNA(Tyr) deacylase [Gemmatimonadetes bacterium]|nr:D-tyrosyl-tRNA(Tyr) deacylase [Gemmatimonadota bacterium]MYF18240.1 D-tyrosyl-tRNA(Tyr) deacylase [Gemmatimonadota bacterium]